MFKYSINLAWSEDDREYVATIPEFPGLSALGESAQKAAEEAQIAAELFIEDMLEDGEDVPEPSVLHNYSGQFRLRLPKSLHAALAKAAERDNVSLNTHIVHVLSTQHSAIDTVEKICSHIDSRMIQMWSTAQKIGVVRAGGEREEFYTRQIQRVRTSFRQDH